MPSYPAAERRGEGKRVTDWGTRDTVPPSLYAYLPARSTNPQEAASITPRRSKQTLPFHPWGWHFQQQAVFLTATHNLVLFLYRSITYILHDFSLF